MYYSTHGLRPNNYSYYSDRILVQEIFYKQNVSFASALICIAIISGICYYFMHSVNDITISVITSCSGFPSFIR